MDEIQAQFVAFMSDIYQRSLGIGVDLTRYPIDHTAFRVANAEDFQKYLEIFKANSILHTEKFFHERKFMCFALRQPLTWQDVSIYFIEFAEPGGSDTYETGFQHVEILTPVALEEIFSSPQAKELLFSGKFGEDQYIKWPDKMVLKLKRKPIIVESLTEDNPQIFLQD